VLYCLGLFVSASWPGRTELASDASSSWVNGTFEILRGRESTFNMATALAEDGVTVTNWAGLSTPFEINRSCVITANVPLSHPVQGHLDIPTTTGEVFRVETVVRDTFGVPQTQVNCYRPPLN